MNPYNFSVLFFAFGAFMLAILILLKRQDKLGVYYFMFSSLAALWGMLFSIMVGGGVKYETALLSSRINNVAAMFVPILWFHIATILSGNSRKKILAILYFSAFLISLTAFTTWFVPHLKPMAGFKYYTQAGPTFFIYTFLFVITTFLGFAELLIKLKKSNPEEKIQLIGLMSATLAGFVAGLITFLPCYGIDFPQTSLFLMPLYPFVMAYFMMKKNLFSLNELAIAAHRDKLAVIGTLAASINHEIRNPLYVIQGSAQVCIANLNDGIYKNNEEALRKTHEALKKNEEQATRAMDIIKRFSLFAKQSVDEATQIQIVDINQVIDDVLPLVRYELELDRIEFRREIPAGTKIKADLRHVEEILFNLIVNACQSMKNTGGVIKIEASRKKDFVSLMVKDNGPGISQKQLAHLFQPFYTTKEHGTGLGLYVTKRLVENSGGKIFVKSILGKGTEFKLNFPLGI